MILHVYCNVCKAYSRRAQPVCPNVTLFSGVAMHYCYVAIHIIVGIRPQGTAGDPPSSPDVYSSRSLMPLGGGRGGDSSPALGSSSSDNSGPLLQESRQGGREGW